MTSKVLEPLSGPEEADRTYGWLLRRAARVGWLTARDEYVRREAARGRYGADVQEDIQSFERLLAELIPQSWPWRRLLPCFNSLALCAGGFVVADLGRRGISMPFALAAGVCVAALGLGITRALFK